MPVSSPMDADSWRSPQLPLRLDVRDYGAVGDGRNDDTTAIQAAIAAVRAAGGGRVFLSPGVYGISSTLTIASDGVALEGASFAGYGGTQAPVRIKALATFSPASSDMISVSDGVNYTTLTDLVIDLNGVATGSGIRLVTGGAGVGHVGTYLDHVHVIGNTAATAYAVQFDSLILGRVGFLSITSFKNGFRWQALNKAGNSFLGNSRVEFLYLNALAPGIAGTNAYLQNLGYVSISYLQSNGDDYTTARTLLQLDNCSLVEADLIDLEVGLNGLVIDGGSGYSAWNKVGSGLISAKNGVLLSNTVYGTMLLGVALAAGVAGGTGLNDASAAGSVDSPNQMIGGEIVTYTTPYAVSNPPKLRLKDVTGTRPTVMVSIAVPSGDFVYTNLSPWPEYITVYGGTVSGVALNRGGNGTWISASSPAAALLYPNDSLRIVSSVNPTVTSWPM